MLLSKSPWLCASSAADDDSLPACSASAKSITAWSKSSARTATVETVSLRAMMWSVIDIVADTRTTSASMLSGSHVTVGNRLDVWTISGQPLPEKHLGAGTRALAESSVLALALIHTSFKALGTVYVFTKVKRIAWRFVSQPFSMIKEWYFCWWKWKDRDT